MTPFLLRLMAFDKLNARFRIEPEQRICIEYADRLRAFTLDGTYRGIWGHIPNEGKRHRIVGMILKRMGLVPGIPDYFHLWRGPEGMDGGVIEFKTPVGVMQPSQKDFRDWCAICGIKHAVCRSAEEGIGQLRAWGAL